MNESTALVGSSTRGGHGGIRGGRRDGKGRGDLGEGSSVVSCFYCKELGPIKKLS